jgi:putative ABC transport system permease protein
MFKSYFIVGWRNLTKQRMYALIKIGGFSLGIAACLLIMLFIQDELSFDTHYANSDRIYRVVQVYTGSGEIEKAVWFQGPFAQALKNDYPEIEKVGRYNSGELFGAGPNQIRRDDQLENSYEENFAYVDQELLEILQVRMVYGSLAHALDEPNTMMITRSKAEKYFAGENPVGKLMVVNNDVAKPYKIGGVMEDFPVNSHLHFEFMITMTGREFWPGEQSDWGSNNYPTYLQLKPNADATQLAKKMGKVIEQYLLPGWLEEGMPDAKDVVSKLYFELQPIGDIHLRSAGIEDPVSHGDSHFVWLFGGIAAFILIIACINFVNLATARSANRAKEVGLRKTVGSHRSNIIQQFLAESLLYSFISFAVGLLTAWLLLPYFNLLAAKTLSIPWTAPWFVPVMIISAFIIGIAAGIYPAFYLSSFKPIQVLKGNISRGSKGSSLRSSLVVFQFTTSIVLIISTFMIQRQMDFMLSRNIGFDKDQVLLIQGTDPLNDRIDALKNQLLELSQVKSVSISDYLPIRGTKRNGNQFNNEGKQKVEQSTSAQFWRIDVDYIETMGMKIVQGRDFSVDMASDSAGIIINQAMVRELGLTDPIGKRIQNSRVWTVIGVVKDFNFESMRGKIEPLSLVLGQSRGIVSVKLNTTSMSESILAIEAIWKKMAPHQPIRYSFLDESFARMYDDVQRMGRIFTAFSILAVIVACLGIFALSAFMVEQRGKEISIRLVMGASLNSIFRMLTLNFVRLVFVSILIAIPIAWYLLTTWLQEFNYRVPLSWEVFALAGMMAVIIAVTTISYQSIRAAMSNPVTNLRSE